MYSDDQLNGGVPAESNEEATSLPEEEYIPDLVEATDEDGNTLLLQAERYFFYNGEEYVVLTEAQEAEDDCDCCHDHAHEDEDDEEAIDVFIMKVVETEENGEAMEEYLPIADDVLLQKLIEVVEADFSADQELDD